MGVDAEKPPSQAALPVRWSGDSSWHQCRSCVRLRLVPGVILVAESQPPLRIGHASPSPVFGSPFEIRGDGTPAGEKCPVLGQVVDVRNRCRLRDAESPDGRLSLRLQLGVSGDLRQSADALNLPPG